MIHHAFYRGGFAGGDIVSEISAGNTFRNVGKTLHCIIKATEHQLQRFENGICILIEMLQLMLLWFGHTVL